MNKIYISLLLSVLLLALAACGGNQPPASSASEASVDPVLDAPAVEPVDEPLSGGSEDEDAATGEEAKEDIPPEEPSAAPAQESPAAQPDNHSSQSTPPVAMETGQPSYPVDTEIITVKITNNTGEEGGADEYYYLEVLQEEAWYRIGLEFDTPDIALILSPGESATLTAALHQDQYDYQPGTYRITKRVSWGGESGDLQAEFTLE